VSTSSIARGAEAGTRWARSLTTPHETENLLDALDRMFEADVWEYRLIYANLVRMRCAGAGEDTVRIRVGKSDTAAIDWWRDTGGIDWPESDLDRASFVKGFVIGAALEMRNSMLV
jgi:hypothetical protein